MLTLQNNDIPPLLREIPVPPRQLFVKSDNFSHILDRPRIAIVGSRKVSSYARGVTQQLTEALVRSGAVIVSGLALGIDSIAHRAALDAGGTTVAVLPGPVTHIYPRSHASLARTIVEQGGALVSEYPPEHTVAMKHQFIDRNRIISGLSDAVIITEARTGSGSLHTARHAAEQGRSVYAVPGPITDPGCAGSNQLIADGLATCITSPEALITALGLHSGAQQHLIIGDTPDEQAIVELLRSGITSGPELLAASKLPVSSFDQAITMLEIMGHIKNIGNGHWSLA